ncbi:helix-turn-helix domain-containing protein [Leisingera aquaemixtae]|uniref:helix-turn-helix domain-containing protein n=1 Tax=Leisingera aquaemixtae TaxID=1396826 RepID=UPI0021A5C393|nr:helix-turn-helix domain-containing protein [Leisingera aquaemixtae]UWQ37346.1 helix-turn-helix domain-containing protein [Leisingera aquaemixtae]
METNFHIPRIAFSAHEAAEMINVKYETILAEIRAGRLVARKVGKEYRIHRDMIDEYLKCPGQGSQPASTWTQRQGTGVSSDPMAAAVGLDYEGQLTARLRKKRLQTN